MSSAAGGAIQKRRDATANPPTVQAVSVALIKLIDEATRDKDSGCFVHVDGTRLPW